MDVEFDELAFLRQQNKALLNTVKEQTQLAEKWARRAVQTAAALEGLAQWCLSDQNVNDNPAEKTKKLNELIELVEEALKA